MSEAQKGKVRSPEHSRKLGDANRGKKRDPEVVERHRQWMLANNPRRGVVMSAEARARLSAANRGKSALLRKYGITDEEYATQRASGNKWCYFKRHFANESEFSGKTQTVCNSCKSDSYRRSDLAKKYNVDHEWYEKTLAEQGGVCAICGNGNSHHKRNKHMMIDHDHTTGKVRGILCGPCNTAIERLETVKNWGVLAAAYLAKY